MKLAMLLTVAALSTLLMSAKGCEAESAEVQAKDATLECRDASDCGEINEDCCGCRQGGKKRAIALAAKKEAQDQLSVACADTMCIQVISNDASCQKEPDCIMGQCQLK